MRYYALVVFLVATGLTLGGCGKKTEKTDKAEKAEKSEKSEPVAVDEPTEEKAEEPAEKAAPEKAEEPKAEEPKAEEPKAEEPKAEAPKAEAPKAEAPKAEEPKAEAPAAKVGELVGKGAAAVEAVKAATDTKGEALSPAEYEKLVLALAACKITERGIDWKCAELKALNKARNAKTSLKDAAGIWSGLGRKHIAHANPAVRYKSTQLMSSFFGAGNDTQKVVMERITKEEHPAVLRQLVNVVGSRGKSNPAIAKMLLANADHKEPVVRKECISWLTTSFNEGVEGRLEKVIEKMTKDKDVEVQAYACERAGGLGDDKLIPIYEKLTADTSNEKLYAGCMKGLLNTWFSYPFFNTSNEKGYKLFLERLKAEPRSKNVPPWTIMSSFQPFERDSRGLKAWKEKVKFFKADEVIEAVKSVVEDEKANWMARNGGVKSMLALGAPKATFEAMVKACTGDDGKPTCNSWVHKSLTEAVGKAK